MDLLAGLLLEPFKFDGRACVYRGMTPDGRYMFASGDGWMLECPDCETGMPTWPTLAQVRELMAEERLILRASPLADEVRRRARQGEPTRDELANAKMKSNPDRVRDRWYTLRESALKKWDEGDKCALSNKGVLGFFTEHYDIEDIKLIYGRVPSARTFCNWLTFRGQPNDRRPADFASESGIVPRRRRVDAVVLAIIKGWSIRFHAKPKQSMNAYFHKAKDDVERYKKGEPLELFDFERSLDKPKHEVNMCARRIFEAELKKAASGKALGISFGMAARRQRYGGGGVAQEPTRFLEYVQLDDTPFPMVFVIDPVRRFPVGIATVTIAICIFTRVIVGWDITYDTPSHATYMRTLLSTALPKKLPPEYANVPQLADLCGKVVGFMLMDNAKHQFARAAQDAGGDIGQAVRYAGKKQPTHKGHVESCLGTLQDLIRAVLPAGTWDIPLMREFDYDPSKHAIVTIEDFRTIFAAAVAKYHTTGHSELNGRTPLEVWMEQVAEHGLDMVRDPDHFQRAIGNVYYPSFRGDGAIVEGLNYGSNGTDERFPLSNEQILHHLALAGVLPSKTKKQTYPQVKIKLDPSDLSKAWLFDPHLREYVPIPCTRRRYAENLPLWLHVKIKEYAKEKHLKFETDMDMVNVRAQFAKIVSRVLPDASIADRKAAARLMDSAEGRAFMGDAAEIVRIESSPSGMENIVSHDLRVETRTDAMSKRPRSSSRKPGKRDGGGDTTGDSDDQTSQANTDQQETAYISRRLDSGFSEKGYF